MMKHAYQLIHFATAHSSVRRNLEWKRPGIKCIRLTELLSKCGANGGINSISRLDKMGPIEV
jgi:hypothetical protein